MATSSDLQEAIAVAWRLIESADCCTAPNRECQVYQEVPMERIVLRHLSGSKANQVEEFPLSHFKELVIGRDPSSTVKYDPDRDDLVGRQHAKVTQNPGDPSQFLVTDL